MKQCEHGRVVIAGTHSGTGKTTLTMGLLRLLSRTYAVQPFKVGPDYIDPTFHSYITGHKCRNLDSYLMGQDNISYSFAKNVAGKDFAVIEGVMGLFDGAKPDDDLGSTAQIAKLLKAPVILVVDAKAMSRSCAPLIKGYSDFDPDLNVAGVIFNNVGSDYHYQLLKKATETYTAVQVLGYLKKDERIALPSRHLGLVPQSELTELDEILDVVAEHISETVDVERILNLIKEQGQSPLEVKGEGLEKIGDFKVAVAYDEAFHFYYWDNIDLLRELGGEIVFFSPLRDEVLPEADLVYLGGGFPEVFAKDLEANVKMREQIKLALEKGMPCIAECGGYMYLSQGMTDLEDNMYEMVGFLPGQAYMTKRLQRFGYATLTLGHDCMYGDKGQSIPVHEFHRSKVEGIEKEGIYHLEKVRGDNLTTWQCGATKNNVLAGYPHLHWLGNKSFITNLIKTLTKV